MRKIVTRALLLLSRGVSRCLCVCVCVGDNTRTCVPRSSSAAPRRNFGEFNNVGNRSSPMITRLRDRRAENNVCSSGNSVTAAQLEGGGSIQLATTARSILPSSFASKANFFIRSPKNFKSPSLFLSLIEETN